VKEYDNLTVVDNLNLTIEENEIFGLLGPKGVGETTTIHMLAIFLKSTSRTAIINGFNI
jgi:ABC-2 type transport system ATP-binding protein